MVLNQLRVPLFLDLGLLKQSQCLVFKALEDERLELTAITHEKKGK